MLEMSLNTHAFKIAIFRSSQVTTEFWHIIESFWKKFFSRVQILYSTSIPCMALCIRLTNTRWGLGQTSEKISQIKWVQSSFNWRNVETSDVLVGVMAFLMAYWKVGLQWIGLVSHQGEFVKRWQCGPLKDLERLYLHPSLHRLNRRGYSKQDRHTLSYVSLRYTTA